MRQLPAIQGHQQSRVRFEANQKNGLCFTTHHGEGFESRPDPGILRAGRPMTSAAFLYRAPVMCASSTKSRMCLRSESEVIEPLPPRAPGTFFAAPTTLPFRLVPSPYAEALRPGDDYLSPEPVVSAWSAVLQSVVWP